MQSMKADVPPGPLRLLRTWSRSVVGRVTLLTGTGFFLLLVGISVVLFFSIKHEFRRQHLLFLGEEIAEFEAALGEGKDGWQILQYEVKDEGLATGSGERMRLLLNSTIAMETVGMSQQLPLAVFPAPVPGSRLGENSIIIQLAERTFRLDAILLFNPSGPETILQAAMDITRECLVLNNYRRSLILIAVLSVVLATFVVCRAVDYGLRPLQSLSARTRMITASSLGTRVSQTEWPSEVADLASNFDAMMSRLEFSFCRLSDFASNLAHELRTPLNNLMSGASVVLTKPRSADEYREMLESSLEEYRRMGIIVNSLLLIARSDDPSVSVDTRCLDANAEVAAVLDYYALNAEEQQITLAIQGAGSVDAESTLLRRALSNLIQNALRYTPAGGCITVEIETMENPPKTVLRVVDTGCGIDQECLHRVGERHFHAHDSARSGKHQAGLGLGFAIVRSIMEMHWGGLSIDSVKGEGTTVSLFFPAPLVDVEHA